MKEHDFHPDFNGPFPLKKCPSWCPKKISPSGPSIQGLEMFQGGSFQLPMRCWSLQPGMLQQLLGRQTAARLHPQQQVDHILGFLGDGLPVIHGVAAFQDSWSGWAFGWGFGWFSDDFGWISRDSYIKKTTWDKCLTTVGRNLSLSLSHEISNHADGEQSWAKSLKHTKTYENWVFEVVFWKLDGFRFTVTNSNPPRFSLGNHCHRRANLQDNSTKRTQPRAHMSIFSSQQSPFRISGALYLDLKGSEWCGSSYHSVFAHVWYNLPAMATSMNWSPYIPSKKGTTEDWGPNYLFTSIYYWCFKGSNPSLSTVSSQHGFRQGAWSEPVSKARNREKILPGV